MPNMCVVIKGELTDSELGELAATLRTIEQRHPEKNYHLIVVDPDAVDLNTVEGLRRLLKIFPKIQGRVIDISKFKMPE